MFSQESSRNSEQEEETEDVTQHIASLQAQLDNIKRSLVCIGTIKTKCYLRNIFFKYCYLL